MLIKRINKHKINKKLKNYRIFIITGFVSIGLCFSTLIIENKNMNVFANTNSIQFKVSELNRINKIVLENNKGNSNVNPLKLEKFKNLSLNKNDFNNINKISMELLKDSNYTFLVNKIVSLPKKYVPKDLVKVNIPFVKPENSHERLARKEMAINLEKLYKDALKDKIYFKGVSGFRSYETQNMIFSSKVRSEGINSALKYSARPGESEHQTGLAMDLSCDKIKNVLLDTFADTNEGKWLKDNCYKYGFIIRYPKGKELITGYEYEPWHIRYVGKDLALYLTKNYLTLEEFYNK